MSKQIYFVLLFVIPTIGLGQQKPQLEQLLAESSQKGAVMSQFIPEYKRNEERRRIYVELLKSQIDTLNISEGKRYKILRDIYQGKESEWIKKYQLRTALVLDSM